MENLTVGNRIIILGCPGSGKSTLAEQLRIRTGLPLIHLDSIWWREDRTHITREEFDAVLRTVLEGEQWIIDGDYSRTYEPRLLSCDTVIFLDYSEEECMSGVADRVGRPRPDIPWTEQELDPALMEQVRRYRTDNRPRLYRLFEKYPDKRVLVFKTREETQAWLSHL